MTKQELIKEHLEWAKEFFKDKDEKYMVAHIEKWHKDKAQLWHCSKTEPQLTGEINLNYQGSNFKKYLEKIYWKSIDKIK